MTHVAIDWAWDEKTGGNKIRVTDGKTLTKKMPEPRKGMIIATENMPTKECKKFLDAGATVFRCSTHQTEKYRKKFTIEKSDDNDVKIIWTLYDLHPDEFYEFTYDPRLAELSLLQRTFKEMQKVRVASSNRLWSSDSAIVKDVLEDVEAVENDILSKIKKLLKQFPIYTEYLSKIQGIAATTAASLISYYGDPRRFKSIACMWAYFGLGVKNGAAQRKRKGERANWHQEGRALILGIIASSFVKQVGREGTSKNGKTIVYKQGEYRDLYDKIKAEEIVKKDQDGNDVPLWQVEKRTKRKMMKIFMKKFFKAYKKLTDPDWVDTEHETV